MLVERLELLRIMSKRAHSQKTISTVVLTLYS